MSLHRVQRPGRSVEQVHRPTTLAEALRLLGSVEASRPVAGGSDLLLDLARGGPGQPITLVDLQSIADFDHIEETDGEAWRLGGRVTHNQVIAHEGLVASALPLAQACLEVGSPQLRNRATIAGNLVTASPANDTISALMALDAQVEIARLDSSGQVISRRVAVAEMFPGFRQTVLASDELISAILVPRLSRNQRGLWVKLGLRKAQAISVVHAGFRVDLADDGTVESARIALGSVAATVILAGEAATSLVGATLTAEAINRAASLASAGVSPIDDGRATATYRSDTVSTLVRRALTALADHQEREMWPVATPVLGAATRTAAQKSSIDDDTEITVVVNGDQHRAPGAAAATLLDWVRDNTGLTGTKEGCAEGECGACTVHLDGQAVMSCLVPAAQADGSSVVTIEGLEATGNSAAHLHPLQQSFIDEFAVQCGFCIPGFLMAGAALLKEFPDATPETIELALSGNLCRCTGYYPIVEAISKLMSEGGHT